MVFVNIISVWRKLEHWIFLAFLGLVLLIAFMKAESVQQNPTLLKDAEVSLEPFVPVSDAGDVGGDAATVTTPRRVMLYSTVSWGSLTGNVTFSWQQDGDKNITVVEVLLERSLHQQEGDDEQQQQEYQWAIHEWPIRYDDSFTRCNAANIGKVFIDLTKEIGPLKVPMAGPAVYQTDKLPILGPNSIWSRSIVFKGPAGQSCSNIHGVGGEDTYETRFHVPLGGSIWFRSWQWALEQHGHISGSANTSGTQVIIFTDVFSTLREEPQTTEHQWMLYITDILDSRDYGGNCNHLARVYDPAGKEECDQKGCPQGLLSQRHGTLRVSARRSRFSKKLYTSTDLILPNLTGPRSVYMAVMDVSYDDHIWGCAKMRKLKTKTAVAVVNTNGVIGKIEMQQVSPFSPTDLTLHMGGLNGSVESFGVHEMPFKPPHHPNENPCEQTLKRYNPYKVDANDSPQPGLGTHDQYELGDLSGKHGLLTSVENLEATVTDYNLPLFGQRSVVGRAIVFNKADGSRWVCGNLRNTRPVKRAAAIFRYPIVGEIMMEQDEEDPYEDTTIYIGPLVYSDGNHNTTGEHDFRIHVDSPGRDFYNWTGRCTSAGRRYNPYKISVNEKVYRDCGKNMPEKCELGDIVGRHGPLQLSGIIARADISRQLLTDANLPLHGHYSVLGHSIVISDKHAPKHRGDRMACTTIFQRFRHKGVVNRWSSTYGVGSLEGKMEFVQETPYDVTNTEIDIKGLEGKAKSYHVHMVRVEQELQFPCAASAVYGQFNPLVVKPDTSPAPAQGTHDLYQIGDLSGKYGDLQGHFNMEAQYNDTNLPLFGHTSIMGRSIVIHKEEDDFRWFCGNIGWGYAPSEATQVSAIASFHNPNGFAWGYIRMRQLIYHDGSYGETFIEVSLRHPGANNRNVTRRHNWSIYVNPVSVDATIKFFQSRCVAGGYSWNPFLIHLAQPNAVEFYDKECTPEFPLRCQAGDISGRLGTIDLGDKKQMFVDSNFPLAGEHNAMGRSIVIHNEQGRAESFACANIEPDDDIIKWANIRKTPRFSPILFMNTMRSSLGCPEWFLQMDLSTLTESEDGECISFLVLFMGPQARKLEQDFARLLSGGLLDGPTITILGVVVDKKWKNKVSYKACTGIDDADSLNDKIPLQWWEVLSVSGSGGRDLGSSASLLLVTSLLFCIMLASKLAY